ncbi:MAG: bifunctional methylenetetrahydrofolate dehydrogenase/methenyltetrahydrofolate cyclohydrolase FolD [Bdellovibrionales bacterium]|nr:bifunctional methylenetetrahydrofolate dehydrogenase/methenyltetrahydrofolate cyclohydrolase FolD [Bdellovibrionales bacterium]
MIRLDGKEVSKALRKTLAQSVEKTKRPPGLGVILVGEDPASQVYVRNKMKACSEVGMESVEIQLPSSASEDELITAIAAMNENPGVDAYLIQLPLPKKFNEQEMIGRIDPKKDADGLTVENLGLLMAGRPRSVPCTPNGVMQILKFYDIDVVGKNVVVIGRSQIVGKPMAQLLLAANATVTVCHSKTENLFEHTQRAEIVVVAAGQPKFLKKEAFKKGAVVIDVGMHRLPSGKLCGDVDPEGLENWVSALTPVPGGVGPMTITMLLQNTLSLYQASESAT